VSDGGDSSVDASLADLAALQGCWEQVYLEVDGVVGPPDEHAAPGALTIISGNGFSVRRATGEVMLEGVFELDAGTLPKSITWIDSIGADAGKRLPASYRLERDSFTFIAADEAAARPVVFRTVVGLTMRGFVRRGDV
jgi:uncharacterized protein (TIGR03067 family)